MGDLREREFNGLKILHHFDRLRALAAGKDIAPVTIEIDPVAYCNHACAWCVDPEHHGARMNVELFTHLIEELATFSVDGFGVEGIVFKGGGEPTLHPEFGCFVDRTVQLGLKVGLVTNGSGLGRWADVLGRSASYVRVSLDGPTSESHHRVHRSGDFDQILDGVSRLLAERGPRRYPIVGLTFAMDWQTVELADVAITLGERLGVDYVLLRNPFFEEVGREPTMTIAQTREVRQRLQTAAKRHAGEVQVIVGQWVGDAELAEAPESTLSVSGRRDHQWGPELPIEHRTGRCLASPVLAVVTADGDVYGCCNLRALPAWCFGRLHYGAARRFADIWRGTQRQAVLKRMHRTECIRHCTHPLARYNEIIETISDPERPHAEFV